MIVPLVMCFVENYWGAFVLRIILGFGNGLCSCLGPLYVTETVVAKYRGRVGSAFQCAITFGLVLAVYIYIYYIVFIKLYLC